MRILSHRGYWKTAAEKNTPAAFARSFHLGFGTETDIRDLVGRLVISHDPPTDRALGLEVMLGIYRGVGQDLPLALNVKADGLAGLLPSLLREFEVTNYFVFDMAIPDTLAWLKAGVPTYSRHSEIEREPPFYDRAAGIWLDAFTTEWWDASVVHAHRAAGKEVCIVSPDLHGRDPRRTWDSLRQAGMHEDPGVLLCTDAPELATEALRA